MVKCGSLLSFFFATHSIRPAMSYSRQLRPGMCRSQTAGLLNFSQETLRDIVNSVMSHFVCLHIHTCLRIAADVSLSMSTYLAIRYPGSSHTTRLAFLLLKGSQKVKEIHKRDGESVRVCGHVEDAERGKEGCTMWTRILNSFPFVALLALFSSGEKNRCNESSLQFWLVTWMNKYYPGV